ncbi:hypothetical protein NDU88_006323 [Pleurodeles waltl]|uniref:Uncharacterized protein n=1 Tax=Pleurodeles waltl TaxID=8319 RepID=A0AAV7RMQ8_PLEWA|nr:hypothetical protein NDU88_006323 [Pleurodeles waltl]
MIQAGGRVIQGYPTEARRIRWGKVLHHLQRVYASQRSDHQLKHRWADLITREQDLLDHLGIMIGGTVAANMTPDQVREFQRRAMQYQHILLVESGFRRMARQEYPLNGPPGHGEPSHRVGLLCPPRPPPAQPPIRARWPHPQLPLLVQHLLDFPGPSIATGAGQPTRPGTTPTQTSSTGTQTATAPSVDPAAFNKMEHKMDKVLRKLSHLSRDIEPPEPGHAAH